MAYETVTTNTWSTPQITKPVASHPEPESPRALSDLSRAAADYAKAAEAFISARHALNDAKDDWQRCQSVVLGLMEKEQI